MMYAIGFVVFWALGGLVVTLAAVQRYPCEPPKSWGLTRALAFFFAVGPVVWLMLLVA